MIDRIARKIRRISRTAMLSSGVTVMRDRRLVRRVVPGIAGGDRSHLVVAAPGAGNIGDQALFEAFLEATGGARVTVVVDSEDSVHVPAAYAERVEVAVLPHLLYGSGAARRGDLRRYAGLLADAASLSVMGADIMDGRYSLRASVNRSAVAAAAADVGVDARILGFSWNGEARFAARRALITAAGAGAVPMLRDGVSARRAVADGVPLVRDVADLVFAASSVDPSAEALLPRPAKPIALVNVSGLISRTFDQVDEYERVIRHLRSVGCHVVLVPHVSRPKGDDVVACAAVAERVGPEDLTVVSGLLSPAQIRGLTVRAAVTVTGRMHLAVMTLMHGTPAITLATQGKVEGLMELFGTPELCVAPVEGFASSVIGAVDQVLPPDSPTRLAIADALPRVRELAARNVDGLHADQPIGAA
ncbi:polysaccharide pyruvyl transferase family protein [Agromyces binzhouensis]|uniref:polysaccharide pyruvyl transferase family protein n=1 Tax=Agromyces binzhouensis TaxID=1817495 RepID=UPI003640CC79